MMKKEIIFWLNPKTGLVYHRLYSSTIRYEVGQENSFGHIILAICEIENKKLKTRNNWLELIQEETPLSKKEKIFDCLIEKLEKMKKSV